MDIIIAILLIDYIVLIFLNMTIDIKSQKVAEEIADTTWKLLEEKAKIRTILLESELISEDKAITVEKIEKVLVNDYQSTTNTSTTHM